MPLKGGRPCVVAAEVREARDTTGRLVHAFDVGFVDRVTPFTVEAVRDRVADVMTRLQEHRPCAVVDVGSPQGLALWQGLRGAYPRELHRPHAYPGTGMRGPLFSAFLQAYSGGRVRFEPGLGYRQDLDRSLVFFAGGGVQKDGIDLSSEDEAMVMALGLALTWPKHGALARAFSLLTLSLPVGDSGPGITIPPTESAASHVRE
jgi:hypothetical protein